MPNTVLFLCTGNYYRSRFAEILFNWLARQRQLDWLADSRGLRLESRNPGPISQYTLDALQRLEIPIAEPIRYPLSVTTVDFESARHIVAVKEIEHRPMIQRAFPEWTERVKYWRVDDIDFAGPEIAIPELQAHVIALVARLESSTHP